MSICEHCGGSFSPKRPHARYCSDACRATAWRWNGGEAAAERVQGHPLDEARANLRAGHTSAQWELIAREKVMRTLLETGEFTADDLDDLNIPEHYRRHIHGAATGYFSGAEPYMEEIGRRKSRRPSRKGAKNSLFVISAKGRRELPRLLRDLQTELPKLDLISGFDGKGVSGEVAPPAVEPGEGQGDGQSHPLEKGDRNAPPATVATGASSPDQLFDPGSLRAA